jgi:hypothetical protein
VEPVRHANHACVLVLLYYIYITEFFLLCILHTVVQSTYLINNKICLFKHVYIDLNCIGTTLTLLPSQFFRLMELPPVKIRHFLLCLCTSQDNSLVRRIYFSPFCSYKLNWLDLEYFNFYSKLNYFKSNQVYREDRRVLASTPHTIFRGPCTLFRRQGWRHKKQCY